MPLSVAPLLVERAGGGGGGALLGRGKVLIDPVGCHKHKTHIGILITTYHSREVGSIIKSHSYT